MKFQKALPPKLTFKFSEYKKYTEEILDMCTTPSFKRGQKAILKANNSLCIVRKFNPLDFKNLYEEYSDAVSHYHICKPPDMSAVFDVFFTKDGRPTTIHTHMNANDFDFI